VPTDNVEPGVGLGCSNELGLTHLNAIPVHLVTVQLHHDGTDNVDICELSATPKLVSLNWNTNGAMDHTHSELQTGCHPQL
jgi:hypothetical protein